MTTVKTKFWLVRHAVVTEMGGKIYGQGDVNCDCSDHAQCAWLASKLPQNAISIASTLKRTHQTHAAVEKAGYSSPISAKIAELNEQSFGIWEGLTYNEVNERYKVSSQQFWLAPAAHKADSGDGRIGESFYDLTVRTKKALDQLTVEYQGQDIALFVHGGTIRAAMAIAMGLLDHDDPHKLGAIFSLKVDNLSLSRLDHYSYRDMDDRDKTYWRVQMHNALL